MRSQVRLHHLSVLGLHVVPCLRGLSSGVNVSAMVARLSLLALRQINDLSRVYPASSCGSWDRLQAPPPPMVLIRISKREWKEAAL